MGYTCVCGERVVVYHVRNRRENVLPARKTVTCRKGHVATFSAQHFALLDDGLKTAHRESLDVSL